MNTLNYRPCTYSRSALHSFFTILVAVLLLLPGAAASAGSHTMAQLLPEEVPTVDVLVDLNLPVSATAAITWEHLHAYAPGFSQSELVYTLVADTTQGELLLNSLPLAQGAIFTQADINSDVLTYAAPAATGTDSFTFHVAAGTDVTADLVYTIHINKPEPTAYPTAVIAEANSISQITVTWTDAAESPAADGYLVLCSPDAPPNPPIDAGYAMDNPCTDGSGRAHAAAGVQTVTWEGLSSETTYYFAIFPYAQTAYPEGNGEYFDYYAGPVWPSANARTLLTYSIQGTVTDGAYPILGARIDAGEGLTTYSGEDGSYSFTGLTPGEYTLSISMPCYTFAPAARTVTVDDTTNHVTGQDFTGTRFPCIHGAVFEGAQPLTDVILSDGSGNSAATSEYGTFSFPVPNNWSGDLMPAKTNYFFTPDRRTYVNVIADQYIQNFVGQRLAVMPNWFTAGWAGTPGALGYYLDVATDPDFTQYVPGYQSLDVGAVTQYAVTGLEPHTHYYYRVRPHNYANMGDYSTPVEVVTIYAFYFPFAIFQ